jgi:hypothetical protein
MSDIMAFLRSAYYCGNTETLDMPLLSRVPNHNNQHTLVAIWHLCIQASKATKDLVPRPSYKVQTC